MLRSRLQSLLKRVERIAQTDLSYLFKQGSWMFASTFGIALIGLVTSYLYANFLTKEQYGEYRYIFSIFATINAFSLTGINIAVTQAVAKGREGALRQSIPLQFKWNIFFCVAFVCIGVYYLWLGNIVFALSLLTLSVLGPVANIANTYGAFLHGKKEFRAFSVINILTTLAIFVSVALVLWFRANVVVLVIANIGTTAVVQGLALFWTFKKYKPNQVKDNGLESFSKRVSLLTALSLIATQLDTVLVFNLLGPVSVSILSFVTIIPDQLRGYVKIIGQLALPKFAANETAESREQAIKKSVKLAALIFVASLVYIAAAPLIFKIFFPTYSDWVVYTCIYALSLVFSVNRIPVTLLYAHKYEAYITRYMLTTTIFTLVASCLFIPLFGLKGAILGRMLTHACHLVVSSYYVWIKPKKLSNPSLSKV